MKALRGTFAEKTRAIFAAGLDIVLHCNGDLAEARAVVAETPELKGEALRRAEAALKCVAGGPKPSTPRPGAPSSKRCWRPRPPSVCRSTVAGSPRRRSFLRREDARIDARQRSRPKAAVFDLRAAVHHHFHAARFGARRRCVVAHAELHPNDLRRRRQRQRRVDDLARGSDLRKTSTMSIRLRSVGEARIDGQVVDRFASEAGLIGRHREAALGKIFEHEVGRRAVLADAPTMAIVFTVARMSRMVSSE